MAGLSLKHSFVIVACFTYLSLVNAGAMMDEDFFSKFMFLYQNHSTCGHRMPSMEPMMRGDGENEEYDYGAKAGEFPWQAAIFHQEYKICSAVLIHEEWLLTAASCLPFLTETHSYSVVVGTTSVVHSEDAATENPNVQHSMVAGIYVHPHYDARSWKYDIALLKVKDAFQLNDYVNVACLPTPTMHYQFEPGMKATVAAFGDPSMMGMDHECPAAREGIVGGDCASTCDADDDCPGSMKCCQMGCGRQCVPLAESNQVEPMDNGITPGMLHKYTIPLRNASMCQKAFNGLLPDSLICAGGMDMFMGDDKMMEGGLLPALKKKMMMMKLKDMKERGEEPEMEDGMMMVEEMDQFDILPILSHLQESVDYMDGVMGRRGMRRGGVWSPEYEEVMRGMDMMDDTDESEEEDEEGRGEEEQEEEGEEEEDEGMMMMMTGPEMGEMDEEMGNMIKEMMEKGMDKEHIMKTMMMKQCKGDKGGPLVAQFKDQWYVLGVTSLPYGCLHEGSPGLFSHLFSLKDWIKPIFNGKEPKGKSMHCKMGEFSCGDGWCIPEEHRCDGVTDCTLETDEHFCEGALKGYNVYYNQAINHTTIAHNFTVHSPEECALACFKAPFLCPGFDVYIKPDGMMMKGMEEEEEEEEEGMGDNEDDDDMMEKPKMICALADPMSQVHHVNTSLSKLGMIMMMNDEESPKGMIHFHFKLPRNAPLSALLSHQFNLRLPTGLVVSPSYILGKNLSMHIGDRQLSLLLMKKTLIKQLVKLSHKACLMSHEKRGVVEDLMMKLHELGEKTTELQMKQMSMTEMEEGMGEEIDEEMMVTKHMEQLMKNVTWIKEHAYELKKNLSMVIDEVMMSCDYKNISMQVHHMLLEIVANYTCMADEGMGGMDVGIEDTASALGKLLAELMLHNMYKLDLSMRIGEGEDMDGDVDGDRSGEMMDIGIDDMMMDMGSMMGDIWGMMGNDDMMSMMMTDMSSMEMDEEMMEEKKMMNITAKKHKLVMKIKMIASMLMMGKCNMTAHFKKMGMKDMMGMVAGDMMGDDMMGGYTIDGDMMSRDTMDGDKMKVNLTEEQHMMMYAMNMMMMMPMGHHKWTIMQSPHNTNNLHFRILDSRGPYNCDNVHGNFGLMVARGGSLPVPMKMMLGMIMKKMKMMKAEGGDTMEMGGEEMKNMATKFIASMTPRMMMSMMQGEEGTEDMDDTMPEMMGEDMEEDERMDGDLMGGMMDEMMNRMMSGKMGRDMMTDDDDMDGDVIDEEVSEEMAAYTHAKMKAYLMEVKKKDGRGVTHCMNELHKKRVVAVDGSHALIDQYSTKAHYHGVVMEYGSDYACDQTIISGPGILTSPMHPMKYPSNAACNHFLVAPPGHVVTLFMLRFRTQWHAHCMHDRLTIYDKSSDGWTKLGDRSFCGTMVPHIFRSSGQHMHVKFESDHAVDDLGFKAFYMFTPAYASTSTTPMNEEPTDEQDTPNDDFNRGLLNRVDEAQEEADTYKIALIAVSCVLGAVLVISMVVMYNHYNNKIRKLNGNGEIKNKI